MLSVEGLSFSYGERDVLRGVDFSIERGLNCLLGPNGSGKSTLMKCIAGILRPREGKILVNGNDVTGLSQREISKLIAYSSQEFPKAFPYTVFEMVLMGRNPHIDPLEGPKEEDEKAAFEALKRLGLEDLAERPFTELSGGEKRLVMIARSIAQGGEVLLFDEPTSFLDFRNQHTVLSVISSLAEDRPVLVSLHDPNLALMFSQRAFLMKNGRIIGGGRAEEVITPENLSLLYEVPIEKRSVPLMVPKGVFP